MAVECAIDMRVVGTETEARALMPAFDAVVSADATMRAAELIEDDLLMSVPEIACDDRDRCPHAPQVGRPDDGRQRPFAGLAALKR